MAIYRVPVELENAALPSSAFNIWHVRTDTSAIWGGDWTSPTVPIGALHDFYTTMAPYMAAGTTVRFPASVVDVETQEEAVVGDVDPITTTATGAAPHGIALTISWSTSIRARRGRGRTFFGPLGGTWSNGAGGVHMDILNFGQTAVNTLVSASSGANGWAIGIYGQQNPGVADPKVLRDITAGRIQNEFAHLRSRRD